MHEGRERRPFLIWTLQRTGGTNLAQRLFDRSGLLEAAQQAVAPGSAAAGWLGAVAGHWNLHEPFNYGKKSRIFGSVTANWVATQDRNALDTAVAGIASLHLPAKHCVEMVPWEVSESLVDAACGNNYRHLFLYRRNVVNRLLSLQFAKLSGIWGPNLRGENELTSKIFAEPLPVRRLIDHENRCVRRLNQAWHRLAENGATACALAFEDLFEAPDRKQAEVSLLPVLSYLGLSYGLEDDRQFVARTLDAGDQGTRSEYGSFKGIDALARALQNVPKFTPPGKHIKVEVQSLSDHPKILHAALDGLPALATVDCNFDMGGVVVLKEGPAPGSTLQLVTAEGEREVTWGIDSPGMAQRFPASPNRANARFRIAGARFGDWRHHIEVHLKDSDGARIPIFKLQLRELPE